jgi:hypothetical protein
MSVSCAKLCLAETNHELHHEETFCCAAKNGKVEVLEWAQDNGYDLKTSLDTASFNSAAHKGHIHVVKFMRNIGMLL